MSFGRGVLYVAAALLVSFSFSQAGNCPDLISCLATSLQGDDVVHDVANILIAMENVTLLNFRIIPDNIQGICSAFPTTIQDICSPATYRCSTSLELPWAERYQDSTYIVFLSMLARTLCASHIPHLLELKSCYTPELQTALLSCLSETGYTTQCLTDSYNEASQCSQNVDTFFIDILANDLFVKNPYFRG